MHEHFILGEPIRLQDDGKWLTDLLGGEFKPYSAPLLEAKDIEPIILGDCEEYKFEFPLPNCTNPEAKAYLELFQFFVDEHNLILLNSEMDNIIRAVDKFKQIYNGVEISE